MVWAMNVKGTLRWTAFSTRFWVSPTPVMFFPSWKQTSMDQRGRVAGDDLGGGRGHVGGHYRDVVAFSGGGFSVAVLDQDDPDRVGPPDPEPEAGDLAGLRGDGRSVSVDQGVDPGVVLGGVVRDVGGC